MQFPTLRVGFPWLLPNGFGLRPSDVVAFDKGLAFPKTYVKKIGNVKTNIEESV